MNTMNYRGYTARIAFDERGHLFLGRVLGLRTPLAFHAQTVAGLRTQFELAVEAYLEACRLRGVAPEQPVSGKIQLRLSPELHGALLVAAQASRKTLNQWAAEVLLAAAR